MQRRFARHPVWYGMVGGLLWGAVMRAWMRYISTDPEFSWGGTGFILGASAIVGTAMGAAWLRRERQGRGVWRFLGLTVLLVGTGAGAVMLPSVLLGALAFGRTSWRRVVRAALLVPAALAQVMVFTSEQLPPGQALLAYPWYAAMITIEAYALSIVFRPVREGPPVPSDVQRVAVPVVLPLIAP